MAIVVVCDLDNLEPWTKAMKMVDPSVDIITIDEVKDKSSVQFVLAWNYPHGLFREYPGLKTISSMGAGVDHLVNDPLLPENIKIVRIADPMLSQDMYEFSLAVIMNRLRLLTNFRENQIKGVWKRKRYLRISDIHIGIMGTGVIGNHIASQLHKSGFSISGWSRTAGQKVAYKKYHGQQQLPDLLENSDILICLLPLTPATAGILNRDNLQRLPKNAWLINLGRGGHLVDDDLIEVLDSGHLDGANLDVFRKEPLPADHPFWSHPKIFITPHIASLPYPESVAPQIIENYHRTINNKPLINKVNRERGY
ncbi:MAG: glyoxylate/hydroxypyruvate reductase A [Bacteroidales bacterium]